MILLNYSGQEWIKLSRCKMGVYLEWTKPETESSYDKSRIWRATSQTGTYSLIHTQGITDNSYYDMDGTTSMWYKITFYDTVTTKESSYSSAIQGGTSTRYCTPNDVRVITNLTASDISDTELYNIITFAGHQLNSDINCKVDDEKISWISNDKTNYIDGSNKTYYLRHYPIGDSTGDQAVTIADLEVNKIHSDGTKSSVTLSSVTANSGKFEVTTAVSSEYGLYVTYKYVPMSVSDPDPLIKTACALLSAAWAYSKINIGKAAEFRIGSLNISRHLKSFDIYYMRYQESLKEINNKISQVEETPDVC
jgi:hypothetical protein